MSVLSKIPSALVAFLVGNITDVVKPILAAITDDVPNEDQAKALAAYGAEKLLERVCREGGFTKNLPLEEVFEKLRVDGAVMLAQAEGIGHSMRMQAIHSEAMRAKDEEIAELEGKLLAALSQRDGAEASASTALERLKTLEEEFEARKDLDAADLERLGARVAELEKLAPAPAPVEPGT